MYLLLLSFPLVSSFPTSVTSLNTRVSEWPLWSNYTEPLLISNLAAAVGYSVQHFQRLFVQEYAVTPHKYLQNLRLERAIQLMTENADILVQDIAIQLGMETNYFIRIFRNTYGCTPGVMKMRLLECEQKR